MHADVPVHLHQIAYSPQTRAALEPGFLLLDNLANERPDWYEYWPIRRHLLGTALDDEAFYGFFSPKFATKTGHRHDQVCDFVRRHADSADVLLFSPQPDMGAFFLNVFEQGETFDPGLIDTFEAFLAHSGRMHTLRHLVMDSRQIVFSNYFVARPAFWRQWLALGEELFALCEGPPSPLQQALTHVTSYPGAAQRKVFVMERLASYLLTVQPHWRTRAADPFVMAWSATRLNQFPLEAYLSDALKIAMREQGFPEYTKAYAQLRERFAASAAGAA